MCSSACVIVLMIVGGQVGANIPDFDVYPNDVLFRFDKSMSKVNDLDVRNALQALNATLQRYNEFQQWSGGFESRDASINGRIGVFLFTRYCGPGARFLNRIFQTDERTYTRIDSCCRKHDECPDYVLRSDDYERYPELDVRPQFFSRLKCSCDSDFYQCLESVDTTYAYSIGIGYGIFQRYCFEYEHPIVQCNEYYTGYGLSRCMAYQVDYNSPKRWQWFDVLPPYLEIHSFPQFIQSAFSFG